MMSLRATINGYTAWANMRLVREFCEADNILIDIMQGPRMKVLLHYISGVPPKKLDNLEGLTIAQKVTRVDWLVDALKACGKLPKLMTIDPQMFSLQSADHVFPVLWHLVCDDVFKVWEICPIFQKCNALHIIIADPIEFGPCRITRRAEGQSMPFYITADGKSLTTLYKQTFKRQNRNIVPILIGLVNGQLKMTVDGRKLHIQSLEELTDSRVLCALVNSLIPGTFTTQVMLVDRWTINLTLETAANIFRVKSHVDSQDIYENEEEGVCAFLTYFIMSGYQFKQAQAVLEKMNQLKQKIEDLKFKIQSLSAHTPTLKQRKQNEEKLARATDELKWIETVYDIEQCISWMDHAKQLQAQVRDRIAQKMMQRFDTIAVPSHLAIMRWVKFCACVIVKEPMTINQLIESMVINLSLTGGNGFYHSEGKESLWTGRKVVVRDKETGDYYDDFTGSERSRGTVRELLKVHPFEIVEINTTNYPTLELFFESTSRNKTLRGGSKFLYQVFPGTTCQCERLLLRASKVGEVTTVEKLILFFHQNKQFVNCKDPEIGNTALHLASRYGHIDIALHLLENGAHINAQNNPGCTPFFLATEGLHRQLSQLLLEWGADIYLKNKVSKTALELIRNSDLKSFLKTKFTEYCELRSRLSAGDVGYFEKYLESHILKQKMASLRSRCIKGNTLFHMATILGSEVGIKIFLGAHVHTNIINSQGATPLHYARNPTIINSLVEHGAEVNTTDYHGNTALHILCGDKANADSAPECISVLVSNGARLDIQNKQGLLPIHCGASKGLISTIEALLALDVDGSMKRVLQISDTDQVVPSLLYLSLFNDQLDVAKWLYDKGFRMTIQDTDKLALRILTGPPAGCLQPAETFEFLLQCGANPNAEYTDANRPLHLSAALVNVPEITLLLLTQGAEINAKNRTQSTPLFAACKANNPGIASKLIENGADYRAQDVCGKCAFDYIRDHKEWVDSGHFTDEVKARLKAFSLKYAKELVKSISQTVNTSRVKYL